VWAPIGQQRAESDEVNADVKDSGAQRRTGGLALALLDAEVLKDEVAELFGLAGLLVHAADLEAGLDLLIELARAEGRLPPGVGRP